MEEAVEVEEERGFGEGDGDNVEVPIYCEYLVSAVRCTVCSYSIEKRIYRNVAIKPFRGYVPNVAPATEPVSQRATASGTSNGYTQSDDDGV